MSELPQGWEETTLGDVTSKIGSGATPQGGEKAYKAVGIPLIRSMNIHFDGFHRKGLAHIDDEQAQKLNNVIVEPGDVLLNITGASIGRVTTVPDEMCGARVNQHVSIIRMLKGLEPKYIQYFLASPEMQRFIQNENYGVTRQALTKGMIEEIIVPFPPFAEQRRITTKLDNLFARTRRAREELEYIPRLVEHYKQAILAAAFQGELTKDWRMKQNLPFIWEAHTLGSVLEDIRYGTSKKCFYEPQNTPVLRIPNITEQGVVHDDIKYASFTKSEIEKLSLQTGDVLIIRSNGSLDLVGKAAIVTAKERDCMFAGYLIRLRFNNLVNPRFILYFLNQPATRARIETLAKSTSGVNNINSKELASLELLLPSLDEQGEIVNRLDAAFRHINVLQSENHQAQKLLDHLDQAHLAKAFRGELVPQDPNDEPASVLLESIHAERAEHENTKTNSLKHRNRSDV